MATTENSGGRPSGPLIEIRNVKKSFGPQVVLKRVNLHLDVGDSFVLVGPSGQGKSTLLKLMAGLMEPSDGQVFWGGMPLLTMRSADRVKWQRQMGMLFQKNALFDSLSVEENVAFPLKEVTALSENEIENRVGHFLRAVKIDHASKLFPSEISGGMQKRLGIARALGMQPDIVFYDDPTAGLDPITSRLIVQLINDLRLQMGSTIVTITNDMNRAYQLAGRIGMVVDGELIETGTVEETKAHKDPRVQQFIHGALEGPLTVMQ